ncbi:hypothetical protein FOCC_FOCC007958 [Frankliniella occidentalis]|nr:hypothetical protein FOCC_FOCC007958 [Frankliniella occidentalis]
MIKYYYKKETFIQNCNKGLKDEISCTDVLGMKLAAEIAKTRESIIELKSVGCSSILLFVLVPILLIFLFVTTYINSFGGCRCSCRFGLFFLLLLALLLFSFGGGLDLLVVLLSSLLGFVLLGSLQLLKNFSSAI